MKTLPILAILAAPGALLLAPLSFEIATSALFAAGFAAIVIFDYSRKVRPLSMPAVAATVPIGVARSERFGLAA
jgi:hypothetical protein